MPSDTSPRKTSFSTSPQTREIHGDQTKDIGCQLEIESTIRPNGNVCTKLSIGLINKNFITKFNNAININHEHGAHQPGPQPFTEKDGTTKYAKLIPAATDSFD